MNPSHTASGGAGSVQIGGIPFPLIDYDGALDLFQRWCDERSPHQVSIVNVHTLVTAQRDAAFGRVLKDSHLCTMDGQPLRWYANLIHDADLKDRVCGPELMWRCLGTGVDRGWRHYLLGGKVEVLGTLRRRIVEAFPGVRLVGMESPPFRPLNKIETRRIIDRINASNADFLWVGLGAPKQEHWIATHREQLNVPVQVGVGAAFDFHAGTIQRAPEAWQRTGFEWLYRLMRDPRLWRRYLSTNPVFIKMMLQAWLQKKLARS
jgi:N-acetylglucosaminyldiphosphoundecaprenol N-acetyl-beta-D-mannosaminyltransferase